MQKERSTVALSYFWIAIIATAAMLLVGLAGVLLGLRMGWLDTRNLGPSADYMLLVAVVAGLVFGAILWLGDR